MNSALSSVENAKGRVFQIPAGERYECARTDDGVHYLLVVALDAADSP